MIMHTINTFPYICVPCKLPALHSHYNTATISMLTNNNNNEHLKHWALSPQTQYLIERRALSVRFGQELTSSFLSRWLCRPKLSHVLKQRTEPIANHHAMGHNSQLAFGDNDCAELSTNPETEGRAHSKSSCYGTQLTASFWGQWLCWTLH